MAVLIAGSALRTCFGDQDETLAALLAGRSGVDKLTEVDTARLNVAHGYPITEPGEGRLFRAGRWLTGVVAAALATAGVDPSRQRVTAVVGTGLRELNAVERPRDARVGADQLDFRAAVRHAAPGIGEVLTVSNACAAAGYALALAQDLLELGEADAVVVGGTDTMTESMLAMIGRVADEPATQVRPFDAGRAGVLLGDGAAAVVVTADGQAGRHGQAGRPGQTRPLARPLARLLATGLSCDAAHETAPDVAGICRAMRDGLERADREPDEVDLVLAHGTGTARNEPAEAAALREVFGERQPLVTAIKGAIGHTSGGSALASLIMAIACLRTGTVFPVVGLRAPCAEADGLRLVRGAPRHAIVRLAQVNSFGFGGVNAVSLIEAAR